MTPGSFGLRFWVGWVAFTAIPVVVVAVLHRSGWLADPDQIVPVYLFAAGLGSMLFSFVHEVVVPFVAGVVARSRRRPPPPQSATGESMIPGAFGLALVLFAIFLAVAISEREVAIVIVALPLIFLTAPLFAMFTFGYTRGQADVGGFAYRRMPVSFLAFLVPAVALIAWRAVPGTSEAGSAWVTSVVVVVVSMLLTALVLVFAARQEQA